MPSKTTKTIVRNYKGERYRLTTRRVIELDSIDARQREPWFALNEDIRTAYSKLLSAGWAAIRIHSHDTSAHDTSAHDTSAHDTSADSINVLFGPINGCLAQEKPELVGFYRIGCAYFDIKEFKRILRNAGCKYLKSLTAGAR